MRASSRRIDRASPLIITAVPSSDLRITQQPLSCEAGTAPPPDRVIVGKMPSPCAECAPGSSVHPYSLHVSPDGSSFAALHDTRALFRHSGVSRLSIASVGESNDLVWDEVDLRAAVVNACAGGAIRASQPACAASSSDSAVVGARALVWGSPTRLAVAVGAATWSVVFVVEVPAAGSGNGPTILPAVDCSAQGASDALCGAKLAGVHSWVAEEEVFEDTLAMWWSPRGDAARLAVVVTDDTAVPEMQIPFYGGGSQGTVQAAETGLHDQTTLLNHGFQYPHPFSITYPKVGAPNPVVAAVAVDAHGPGNGAAGPTAAWGAVSEHRPAPEAALSLLTHVSLTAESPARLVTRWCDRAQWRSVLMLGERIVHSSDPGARGGWIDPSSLAEAHYTSDGSLVSLAWDEGGSGAAEIISVPVNRPAGAARTLIGGAGSLGGVVPTRLARVARDGSRIAFMGHPLGADSDSDRVIAAAQRALYVATKTASGAYEVARVATDAGIVMGRMTSPWAAAAPAESLAATDCAWQSASVSEDITHAMVSCHGPGTPRHDIVPLVGDPEVPRPAGAASVLRAPADPRFASLSDALAIEVSGWLPPRRVVTSLGGRRLSLLVPRHIAWDDGACGPRASSGIDSPSCARFLSDLTRGNCTAADSSCEAQTIPLLVHVYGGPGSQAVSFADGVGFHDYLVSKHNMIVAEMDGAGTAGNGLGNMFSVRGRLGDEEARSQIEGIRALLDALSGIVDPARVGLWGWSYGGFMTLRTVSDASAAGLFAAAVSVAPVADWLLYDSVYTERYMGELGDADGSGQTRYNSVSLLGRIADLKAPTFLAHGTGDDNVHVQNSMQIVNEAIDAGQDLLDVFFFPDRNHGIYGGNTRSFLYRRIERHLVQNLVKK